MTRPGILALLVAVLLAWVTLEGFWAHQDSRPVSDPCGKYPVEEYSR